MTPVEVNGVTLPVDVVGDGPAVVLVHGSWVDRQTWSSVFDELALSFRVIRYDRRGHAVDDDGRGVGTRHDDEDDLAGLIETFELGPAHVVGSSFGGSISVGLSVRRPDLVRSLCVHEPPLIGLAAGHPAVARFVAALPEVVSSIDAGDGDAGARRFVDEVIAPGMWDQLGPSERSVMIRNAATFAEEVRDPNFGTLDFDGLDDFVPPVLVTQGGNSSPMFAPIVAQLSEALPAARVTTIGEAGHSPHRSHPDEWLAIVTQFVAGVEG
jgi:pimeloyl-ACP methyl ester carboxylesterase